MTARMRPSRLTQPLIVGCMVGALVLSIVGIVGRLSPGWSGTYVAVLCAIATAESMYASGYSRRLVYTSERWKLYAIELGTLFIVLQLASDLEMKVSPIRDSLPRVDGATVALFALVLAAWWEGRDAAEELDSIGEDPADHRQGVAPAQRLAGRFFAGGILIFLTAGLSQATVVKRFELGHAGASGPILNVLVYFALGMVMLGQLQFATMQARWHHAGAIVAGSLSVRWLRYSFGFLCGLVVLAFLLPSSYTLGLLDLARSALDVIVAAVLLVQALFAALLSWLLSSLHLHSASSPSLRHPTPPPVPRARPRAPTRTGGNNWVGAVRSIIFWLVAGVVTVYLVRSFWRQHARSMRVRGPLAWVARLLVTWWNVLRRGVARYAVAAATLTRRVKPAPAKILDLRGRVPWTVARSPREQVIRYYLFLVRRAGDAGIVRRQSETAIEFESRLAPSTGEETATLEGLTTSYLIARYSDHAVLPDDASRVRDQWQRLRRAIRKLRAGSDLTPGAP